MAKKIRILHVLSNFGVGGAETWIIALLRYFNEAAARLPVVVETDVLLTHGVTSMLDQEARRYAANLYYSKFSRATLPRFVRDWRKCLVQGRYDAIHDHQEFTAGWHFLMGLGHLPKVRIAHLHNAPGNQRSYLNSVLRKMTFETGGWLVAKLATHCLSTSARLIEERGCNSRRYRNLHKEAVYCGFNVDIFQGDAGESYQTVCEEFSLPPGAKIMLFVGRYTSLDPTRNLKNPEFCLEVARRCAVSSPDYFCLIAGRGDAVQVELDHRVKSWGVPGRIRFLGPRSDIPRLMRAAHVLLMPSIAEGLGMVAVEAQAAGLPVVASDSIPHECRVVEGMVDFLPLSDGPDNWAKTVLAKMSAPKPDPQWANRRVKDSGFSIQRSAERLIKIYSGTES
jgi:glycosyltransferase EpsF